jgi:hypothetical protein
MVEISQASRTHVLGAANCLLPRATTDDLSRLQRLVSPRTGPESDLGPAGD